MPIDFEIQQGLPCVFTNLPNLLSREANDQTLGNGLTVSLVTLVLVTN